MDQYQGKREVFVQNMYFLMKTALIRRVHYSRKINLKKKKKLRGIVESGFLLVVKYYLPTV